MAESTGQIFGVDGWHSKAEPLVHRAKVQHCTESVNRFRLEVLLFMIA
jgi:hypothetical protein